MKLKIIFLSISLIFLTSCESNDETTTNTDSGNTTDVQVFTELIFTPENAYFSTNGSMTTPVNSDQAQQISDEIDRASKNDEELQRLCTVPGIGPVTAGAIVNRPGFYRRPITSFYATVLSTSRCA